MTMLGDLVVDELEAERTRDAMRAKIRELIDGEQVTIALQPIVAFAGARCCGLEALSRFGGDWGRPDAVFAMATELGLGLELERMVAAKAYELLERLHPDQYLSVNLSPLVAYELASAIPEDSPVALDRLVLEITEHAAVDAYMDLRKRLSPLRKRGLRLAIDDAGAGFASLQHVVELSPDLIKIDRAFIDGLAEDPAKRSVVTAFVTLAKALGATVVAEGVETQDDLSAAAALGVDAAQGYLLARPSVDEQDHVRWAEPRTWSLD